MSRQLVIIEPSTLIDFAINKREEYKQLLIFIGEGKIKLLCSEPLLRLLFIELKRANKNKKQEVKTLLELMPLIFTYTKQGSQEPLTSEQRLFQHYLSLQGSTGCSTILSENKSTFTTLDGRNGINVVDPQSFLRNQLSLI